MNTNAINFGSCWGTPGGADISLPSYMATGFQCIGEAVARRWSTSRGQLITDPNYGTNVTDSVGSDFTPQQLAYLQQQLAVEAQKDERVLRCAVTVQLTTPGLLTVVGVITTAAGPFRLVLSVSAVTTTILLNG